MSEEQLSNDWQDLKSQVKEHWSKITEEELKLINGDKEKLVKLIKHHYNESEERIHRLISLLLSEAKVRKEQVKEHACQYQQKLKAVVVEKPLHSLLLAAAGGVILGLLLRRR